ncbi:hypothetical protein WN943_014584 [Citrus x changshan-huyou]
MEGFGQAFVISEEQKVDWIDIFFMTTLPIHLRKPHLFPKLPLYPSGNLGIYSVELKLSGHEPGRLSIGTIYSVRYDGEMYPASNLVSENTPPLFKRVTVEEYFGNLCARKLRGKSHLDALRIEHIQD